jgi:hypothetical protein
MTESELAVDFFDEDSVFSIDFLFVLAVAALYVQPERAKSIIKLNNKSFCII